MVLGATGPSLQRRSKEAQWRRSSAEPLPVRRVKSAAVTYQDAWLMEFGVLEVLLSWSFSI